MKKYQQLKYNSDDYLQKTQSLKDNYAFLLNKIEKLNIS